ncbi:VOC family protein [Paenibacillus sp. TH7-28]
MKTNKFSELKSFYRDVLRFPILEETNTSFSVDAGETVVIYESGDLHTFYHYAFFVNKAHFDRILEKIVEHSPLLADETGQTEFMSGVWKRKQVYFKDAQGNILEILPTGEELSAEKTWVRVQEFGVPVDNLDEFISEVNQISNIFPKNSDHFCFYGDESGVLVLVKEGRPWFPTDLPAISSPAELIVVDDCQMEVESGGFKLKAHRERTP